VVARLALELTERCAELTITVNALKKEITELTAQLAPALLELPGRAVASVRPLAPHATPTTRGTTVPWAASRWTFAHDERGM
jgi:hypothetical protein